MEHRYAIGVECTWHDCFGCLGNKYDDHAPDGSGVHSGLICAFLTMQARSSTTFLAERISMIHAIVDHCGGRAGSA
jgi:hypothetical protein